MARLHAFAVALAAFCWWAFPTLGRADDPNPDVPASLWQTADFVRIKATAYPAPPAEAVSFDLLVSIMPPIFLDQIPVPAWKVQFLPAPPVVPPYGDSYKVWVGKEDGWTRKAALASDWPGTPLDAKAGAPFLLDPPAGYPLELFPLVDSAVLKTPDGAVTVTISKQAEGDRVWMTAAVRKGDKETLKIRQRWKPGDKWWTDYERYRDGRKELTAQAGPPVGPTPLPPPTPPPPGAPAVSDLKDDERLHVPITLDMVRRPVQDLLDVVSEKTGAPLTIDAPLAAAVPMFSSYSFVNMPAHQVMDQIAYHSIVDGRWEKAGDGYCLHGTRSVDPRPVVGPPAPAPDLRWRLILVVASLALVGGSGAVWAVFHFRRKRVPPAV